MKSKYLNFQPLPTHASIAWQRHSLPVLLISLPSLETPIESDTPLLKRRLQYLFYHR